MTSHDKEGPCGVVVVYSASDGEEWASYIVSSLQAKHPDPEIHISMETDTAVLTDQPEEVALVRTRDSRILMLILTPDLEKLVKKQKASLDKLIPTEHKAARSVLLFCGTHEKDIDNNFPFYDKWVKDIITGRAQDTDTLVEKLSGKVLEWIAEPDKKTDKKPQPRMGKKLKAKQEPFLLFPDRVRCDDDMPELCLALTSKLPGKYKELRLEVKFPQDTEFTPIKAHMKLNPHTFRLFIQVPESSRLQEGRMSIRVWCGETLIGSKLVECYEPYEDLQAASHVYVAMMDALYQKLATNVNQVDIDRILVNHLMNNQDLPDRDNMYSYMFQGLDSFLNSNCLQVLPTLLHFAAKHSLRELVAHLLDIEGASNACQVRNCDGKTPASLAMEAGSDDVANVLEEFFKTSLEEEDIYVSMAKHYQEFDPYYKNMRMESVYLAMTGDYMDMGTSNKDEDDDEDDEDYLEMDGPIKPDYVNRGAQALKHGYYNTRHNMTTTSFPEVDQEDYTCVEDRGPPPPALKPRATTQAVEEKSSDIPKTQTKPKDTSKHGQSQEELIKIMNMVKSNEITMFEAEYMFKDWQHHYKGGRTGSFKDKQEHLIKLREDYKMAKSIGLDFQHGNKTGRKESILGRIFKKKEKSTNMNENNESVDKEKRASKVESAPAPLVPARPTPSPKIIHRNSIASVASNSSSASGSSYLSSDSTGHGRKDSDTEGHTQHEDKYAGRRPTIGRQTTYEDADIPEEVAPSPPDVDEDIYEVTDTPEVDIQLQKPPISPMKLRVPARPKRDTSPANANPDYPNNKKPIPSAKPLVSKPKPATRPRGGHTPSPGRDDITGSQTSLSSGLTDDNSEEEGSDTKQKGRGHNPRFGSPGLGVLTQNPLFRRMKGGDNGSPAPRVPPRPHRP